MEQSRQNRVITSGPGMLIGMLIGMLLIYGCGFPQRNTQLLPDSVMQARTPILLTSEARAEATAAALDEQLEGFEGRTNAGSTGGEVATTDGTAQTTREAEQEATADPVTEAQLTKAPTIAAFLTRMAGTPDAEGTPSPPSGCPGGCTTYPTWCEPPIKGAVSAPSGERIYIMPDDDAYDETTIDPDKGEYYFCTPDEAEAAGFRPSSN